MHAPRLMHQLLAIHHISKKYGDGKNSTLIIYQEFILLSILGTNYLHCQSHASFKILLRLRPFLSNEQEFYQHAAILLNIFIIFSHFVFEFSPSLLSLPILYPQYLNPMEPCHELIVSTFYLLTSSIDATHTLYFFN